MDEVATGLFVGTVEDAGSPSRLGRHDVTTIVSLTHRGPDAGFPSDVTVVEVPMTDGPRNEATKLERAVDELASRLDAGETVLVHCSAGASRSPAVAATALALERGIGLDTAFDQVTDRRSEADPHDALVRQAARVYTDSRSAG